MLSINHDVKICHVLYMSVLDSSYRMDVWTYQAVMQKCVLCSNWLFWIPISGICDVEMCPAQQLSVLDSYFMKP